MVVRSTVAAKEASRKVSTPQRPATNIDSSYKLVPNVVYEDEIITRKETNIDQQAWIPGSVLFSFPSALFGHRTEAYGIIEEQISTAVQFRTLSLYRQRPGGDLNIEANFNHKEDALKAVGNGAIPSEVAYKTSFVKDSTVNGKLVYVQLAIVHMPNMGTFLADLMNSLSYHEKVYQVKKYKCCGHFEGQVSVLIDTSASHVNNGGKMCGPEPLTTTAQRGGPKDRFTGPFETIYKQVQRYLNGDGWVVHGPIF